MKFRSLGTVALLALLMAAAAVEVRAQLPLTPFLSKEGIPSAKEWAATNVAADAVVMNISTFGYHSDSLSVDGLDMADGKAPVWIYAFYSPSLQTTGVCAMTKVLVAYIPVSAGEDTIPVMPGVEPKLDLTGSYAGSDKLVEAIKANDEYKAHILEHPEAAPTLVTLTNMPAGEEGIPMEFPVDKPVWTVVMDTTMVCLVATGTGETICQTLDVEIPSSVSTDKEMKGAVVTVVPNPTSGIARIGVTFPAGTRNVGGATVALYDGLGRRVADLTESFVRNDYRSADFDASELPDGVYYCRIVTDGGAEIVRTIVVTK